MVGRRDATGLKGIGAEASSCQGKKSIFIAKNLVIPGNPCMAYTLIGAYGADNGDDGKVEGRWRPFRNKPVAGVLGGMDKIFIALA